MFYNKSDLINNKRKIKISIVLSIVLFILVLIFIVTTSFFINDKTIILFTTLDSIILSTISCFILYVILNIIIPLNRRNIIINKILLSKEILITFKSYENEGLKTINHTEKAFLIHLKNDDGDNYVYLDSTFSLKITDLDESNKVIVRNNYITEILK